MSEQPVKLDKTAWLSESITALQYASAVSELIGIARNDCSGSRACAQVLLSAYNGTNWQLDVTDLCVLDDNYYHLSMIVIRGRIELRTEPHELIVDGSLVFEELCSKWHRYRCGERHRRTCNQCDGSGFDSYTWDDVKCPKCDGSGYEE